MLGTSGHSPLPRHGDGRFARRVNNPGVGVRVTSMSSTDPRAAFIDLIGQQIDRVAGKDDDQIIPDDPAQLPGFGLGTVQTIEVCGIYYPVGVKRLFYACGRWRCHLEFISGPMADTRLPALTITAQQFRHLRRREYQIPDYDIPWRCGEYKTA